MDNYLSISEFAEKSGIKRKTLIYYDKIDLLKPQKVCSNGYRYYHYHQLYTVNMIRLLKETGLSLSEIKMYQKVRAPNKAIELLKDQKKKIIEKANYYTKMEQMVTAQIESLAEYESIESNKITKIICPDIPLFFLPNSFENARFSTSLTELYQSCISSGYDFPFPPGIIIYPDKDKSTLKNLKLYTKVPQSKDYRQKGEYLLKYLSGKDSFDEVYFQLKEYEEKHQLKLANEVYIDVVTNELVSKNFGDFYLKMMIRIK